MRLIIIVFGLFFSAAVLHGQLIDLEPWGSLRGSIVEDFAINKDGEILAFQKGKGLVISFDKGITWSLVKSSSLSNPLIKSHPEGDFFLLDTRSGLLYTYDSLKIDLNFEILQIGEGVSVSMDIADDGEIFLLMSNGKIISSTDKGESWGILFDTGTSQTFYSEIFLLKNDNENIYLKYRHSTRLSIGRINKQTKELHLIIEDRNKVTMLKGILYLNNELYQAFGDSILKNSTTIFTFPDNDFLVQLTSIDQRLVAKTKKGFYSSDDFGDSWSFQGSPNIKETFNTEGKMLFDMTDSTWVVRSTNYSHTNFFRVSTDLSNWDTIKLFEDAPVVWDFYKLESDSSICIANNVGFLPETFHQGGIQISYDDGQDFNLLEINDTTQILMLSIGLNDNFFALGTDRVAYKSSDKGLTWQMISIVSGVNHPVYWLKANKNGELFAVINEDEIFYSKNNGFFWSKISNGLGYYIDIHPNGDLYKTLSGVFSRYSSNENRWIDIAFINGASTILGNGHIIVAGLVNGEVLQYYSIDGTNFFTRRVNSYYSINWRSLKGRIIYSKQNGDISISQNEGLTWTTIYSNPDTANYSPTSAYLDNQNYLYLTFSGNLIQRSTTPLQLNSNLIKGNIQVDDNHNCLNDSLEVGFKGVTVSAVGQDTFYANTYADGTYEILVPEGTFKVSATVDTSLWQPCDSFQTVTLSGTYDTAFVDFSLKAKFDCPKLEVDLTTPRLRRCFDNTYYVNYKNTGTIAADTPFVKITLDPRFNIKQATIPFSVENDSCYIFPLDTIDVFEEGNFSFVTEMECDSVILGETICAEAHIFPDSICGTPSANWSGASLESTAECIGDSIIFKIKNVGNGDMNQARQYIIIEDVVIMRISPSFNLPAGDSLRIPIEAIGQTYHLEVPQVDNHPGQFYPSVTVESCGQLPHSLGLFNQFSQNDNNPFIDIECREVIGAYDPNDKAAVPRGIDVEHKIQPNSTIEYLIRFQNTGTDTAFSVNIIDTLSQWLDVTSFVAGASSHSYEYEISGEGTVRFIFNNIMLPDSNINEVASNGFIKYKIAMKADLPIGTEILNDADIYFDFNAPIRTNETFHVIDEPWILVKTSEVFVPGVEVNAYPNPFQHQATIKLSNVKSGQKKFRLFDFSGRQIRQQYFDSDQFIFEKQSLTNGIYFYEISGEGAKIAVGKLIVQ